MFKFSIDGVFIRNADKLIMYESEVCNLNMGIKEFGSLFYGRLDAELLGDAIGYVAHGESALAFETICDHLSEYDVPITEEEYSIAMSICDDLKMDINDISFTYMKRLIVK